MESLINERKSNKLISIYSNKENSCILNNELFFANNMIDNQIVDYILSYKGYSPSMRTFYPHHLFRAELLKVFKYPEISYRKFCTEEYLGMHQKENKCFIGLPLNRNIIIDHTLLAKFRNSLNFTQLTNLLVYFIYHFKKLGYLDGEMIHGLDSTELAVENQTLLASITINNKKIRIYDDLDCDCGKRRRKRDKSQYVIGYRLHTLTSINPHTGHSYPLVSLLAPANHHDSHFAHPLIALGQAIGLNVKLVTADEAYHDNQAHIYNDLGTCLITPARETTSIPDFVDIEKKEVFCNKNCSIAMEYVGIEDDMHEFKCNDCTGTCPFSNTCAKYRHIPIDSGQFQRIIPFLNEDFFKAIDIRKNAERPFNLIKNREGLKETRTRNKRSILTRCIFTQISTLIITMAETRKKSRTKSNKHKECQGAFVA